MHYLISLYISIWYSLAFKYVEKIPKPKYTAQREYAAFVRYQQNYISVPYPNKTFRHFNEATYRLIEGQQPKLNIVHFGDSHIQADFFSDQVRSHFNDEKLLGNGGRGYFFPCSMAQSHDPYNMKVYYQGKWSGCKNIQASRQCSWGLGGMIASTGDSEAKFTIDPNSRSKKHHYGIRRARVYYRVSDPHSFQVKLLTSQGAVDPVRLNADGFAEFMLDSTQEKVTFTLVKQNEQQNSFVLEGVALDNGKSGVQYHSVGVNSATVPSFLRSPKLEEHLHSLSPDLVIISLGTNDAYTRYFKADQFKLQYTQLVHRVKAAAPQASILLTTPGDCGLPGGVINPSNRTARAKIFEIAEENDCAVWDLFTIMGGFGSVNHWLARGLSARDRVHLSGRGYRLQGDLLYDALIQNYVDYCFKKINTPEAKGH